MAMGQCRQEALPLRRLSAWPKAPEHHGSPSAPIHGLAGCRTGSSEQKHRRGATCSGCGCPVCRRGRVTHQITIKAVRGWGWGWAGDTEAETGRARLPSAWGTYPMQLPASRLPQPFPGLLPRPPKG